MWRGFEEALAAYGLAICAEWSARGHADTCADKIVAELTAMTRRTRVRSQVELRARGRLPPWLGRRAVHASHRAALLRKAPESYRPHFGAAARDDVPYVWPVPLD
jgi:pyruvate/2-oxoglutarate/acetoin dehydrogenase E1 component